ncbi:ABC transporter substrate-binding protein [Thermohalobacter berrensis]|uniref:Amino acid ABC transporter n=1 Tax=Thermohalobacter berrensis TaxID=99594 RepID=A0A419SXS9_9FIRM|nr:ABC transporter substrate-binding protein [Thermohalobacter berrensis]RKD30057.1 amino acid ABC transporter [Thermohalobacter berrensis]
MFKAKKYSTAIILILLTVLMVFTGCSNKSTLAQIKEKGKLIIGTSAGYPPYEFHEEINGKDEIVGFDISIAEEIAKDLGVELEIKDMKFEGLLSALNSGKVDIVIAAMTPTEERKKSVDFSKVYYTAVQGVIVRAEDKEKYNTLDDLKGKVIGVQKGTIQEQMAREQIENPQIKALNKIPDIILQLQNGKVDAVLVEKVVGEAYANKNEELAVSNITLQAENDGTAIAIKKGSPKLVGAINKTLDRLMKNNDIEKFFIEAVKLAEDN